MAQSALNLQQIYKCLFVILSWANNSFNFKIIGSFSQLGD